jgi:hypothetical protein
LKRNRHNEKNVDIDLYIIAKKFEEEVNSTLKEVGKQLTKKCIMYLEV